jgi:hypothetical protein
MMDVLTDPESPSKAYGTGLWHYGTTAGKPANSEMAALL